ncbi:Hypothetical predicted protein [Octopus vulgaris]|uniref:Uncharacterized protein n=1 Tax=Octopus vulgaris TaxID=6645 RepID=A0AA36B2G7_OCTVU|nr:Hypothetical predicted protein [Octopus vulgaris]
MSGIWKKRLKSYANTFEGFEQEEELEVIRKDIVKLANNQELECEIDDVEELLDYTPLSASLMAGRCDIFFLCDIFTKLNDLNKILQGNRKPPVNCKSFITTFISKTNISKRQFHQFPQLDYLKDKLVHEDLTTYRTITWRSDFKMVLC